MNEAKCVIVLWSAVAVASEWVRSEASEGKRRGILIPVFLETVDVPLAFRLLNGADLSDWRPGVPHAEFDKLTERVAEVLAQPPPATIKTVRKDRPAFLWPRLAMAGMAALAVGLASLAYYVKDWKPPVKPADVPTGGHVSLEDESGLRDMIKNLPLGIGGPIVLKAFYEPELGLRTAFISQEQSEQHVALGFSRPSGAVVLAVEGNRPASRAGLDAGDVIMEIDGRKIGSEDDLRQALRKIGPGETRFSFRRGNDVKTVVIDCPTCKAN